MEKTCKQCGESRDTGGFYRSKRYSDGLDIYCKDCRNGRHAQWVVANRKPPAPKPTEKACTRCGLVQPVTAFQSNGKGRRSSLCRECSTARHREWAQRPGVAEKLREKERARGERKWKRPPRREPIGPGFEVCTICNEDKPLDEFHNHKLGRNGKDSMCRECKREYARVRTADPTVKARGRELRLAARFGLEPGEYERMLAEQGGVCFICGQPPREGNLHVDHCHTTGAVRGLLCRGCNAGLGLFRDDPAVLRAAIGYLQRNQDKGGT